MYVMFRLIALVMMFLSMQMVVAAGAADVAKAEAISVANTDALPPAYPTWPERAAYVNAVPAPPLGPYMSTGLQEISRGFACCDTGEEKQVDTVAVENRPWPKRRLPPRQWQPENGEYRFAPENAVDTTGAAQPGRYANPGSPWQQPMQPPMRQWLPQGGYR